MSKMTIMQGLPASGKSTRALEIIRKEGNTVRINKDLIRTMLHFDKFNFTNEDLTRKAARMLTKSFLEDGVNVIIDDTNLNEGTLQSWKDLAKECNAKIKYEDIDTDWATCVFRDTHREKRVGREVIMNMAFASGRYPRPEKPLVLCDLDGTLCDIRHRLHFVKNLPEGAKADWKGFFAGIPDDTVNPEVQKMLIDYYNKGHNIVLVSARPDAYRQATEEWLTKHMLTFPVALFMRRDGDHRVDTEVKKGMYESLFEHKYPIEVVIDDRPSVIRMWRELGLNVIDVGGGVEF